MHACGLAAFDHKLMHVHLFVAKLYAYNLVTFDHTSKVVNLLLNYMSTVYWHHADIHSTKWWSQFVNVLYAACKCAR